MVQARNDTTSVFGGEAHGYDLPFWGLRHICFCVRFLPACPENTRFPDLASKTWNAQGNFNFSEINIFLA